MTLMSRLRQIAMVGGVESFGVIGAGIAGLLIVNIMPKDQYAVYTFLIACMQLTLGITDLGLSQCSLPIVGQRNKDVPWVVGVCQQIFRRRWLLLAVAFTIVVPYWAYTFWQHGWFAWAYGLSSALVVVVVLVTLRNHYVNTVLLVLSHISTISRIGFSSTAVRLALVCIALFVPIGNYVVAGIFFATAAAEVVAVWLYKKALNKHHVNDTRLSSSDQKIVDAQMLKIALPLVPSSIFYQIQGVVTIFIVSLFGTTAMLAEIGAFGRLALVLAIVDRVAGVLLFPAIARIPTGDRLARLLIKVHSAYFALMLCVLLTGIFAPHYWIILLGDKYRSMEPYVWMVFLASILMNAAGTAFLTLAVRGLTEKQGYGIPLVLITQVVYLWVAGVDDLPAILGFNIATCAAHFIYQYTLLFFKWPDLKFPQEGSGSASQHPS